MKKRFKVRFTDPQSFYKEFDDGSCIGGQYGNPISITLHLNKAEMSTLMVYRSQCEDLGIVLYNFINNGASEWHRRQLLHYFKAIPDNFTLEMSL
jgi:hypothetical protein